MVRFGVEEEFMTLHPHTLAPVPKGPAARVALHRDATASARAGASVSGDISAEFMDCQVEVATSPAQTLDDARCELTAFRASLRAYAQRADVVVCSAGAPYGDARESAVTSKSRYRAIADLMGGLTREHLVNGLHVHVEECDVEERVRALNAVRPWLPVLLALSANSPLWGGEDSGFASWRSILIRRLATMWCPPVFQDADDYQRRIDRLIDTGAVLDQASIAWAVRVSHHLDTVEVRVFDAQLTVADTLLAAALTRSLIVERPVTAPIDSEAIDASLWMAARSGMDARLIDPLTGGVASAWSILGGLRKATGDALRAHDDAEFVDAQLAVLREQGTGAARQRAALAGGGTPALRALLDGC